MCRNYSISWVNRAYSFISNTNLNGLNTLIVAVTQEMQFYFILFIVM
jgi:hypothetical protein